MTGALPRWSWIAALLTAFAVGAVVHLPLRLALRLAGSGALAERVVLEGSVARWRARTADGLELRFVADPLVLLTGRYGGRFEAWRGATRFGGDAVRSWGGAFEVDDATLAAGLAPLAAALGLPPSMLAGELEVGGIEATWRGGALTALACHGAVSGVRGGVGVDAMVLGDLGVSCSTPGDGPLVLVEDRGGPLAFRAELRFAADGRFLLDGTAGARPGAPPALAEVLPLLGRASGPDQVSFRYAGALPAP
jgi:hypothetical protein